MIVICASSSFPLAETSFAVGAVFGAAATIWALNSEVSPKARSVAVAVIRSPISTVAVNAGEVNVALPVPSVTTVIDPR